MKESLQGLLILKNIINTKLQKNIVLLNNLYKEQQLEDDIYSLISFIDKDLEKIVEFDSNKLKLIIDKVFSSDENIIKKIKGAQYLISSCKKRCNNDFPQYKEAVYNLKSIVDDINKYHKTLVDNSSDRTNRKNKLIKDIEEAKSINEIITSYGVVKPILNIEYISQVMNDEKLDDKIQNEIINSIFSANIMVYGDNFKVNYSDTNNINLKEVIE